MNNLKRELAPISSAAWKEIDAEATRVLKLKLAGRKLVDFEGPLGPTAGAVNTGRREPLGGSPADNVEATRRQTLPLIELRSYFELSREEIDAVERGAEDPELQPLIDAASRIAYAEDTAIFHGYAAGGIEGIDRASAHPILPIPDDYQAYPHTIAEATRLLRLAGVDGPYAIAMGPRYYAGLTHAVGDGGYPVLNVVRALVDGPLVWAPAVNGAIVVSLRGGDFKLTIGTDVSIAYQNHTDDVVRLYLLETMAFRVLTPEAAVALTHDDAKAKEGQRRR
jgi:uncharacterized linocin/CFP29 family protein